MSGASATLGHAGPYRQLAAVVLFGGAASAAAIGMFVGSKEIVFALLALVATIFCVALSGNQRLFCLYGLALTLPLGAQKSFWVSPHMGGADALTIDMCDVFAIPLALFILRDLKQRRLPGLRFTPVMFWWGAMIALGLLNVVFGPYRHLATLEVIRMTKSALLFMIFVNEVVRVRQIIHVVVAIVSGIALQSVFALIQFAFKANLGLQFLGEPVAEAVSTATKSVYLDTTGGIYRAGGLFSHPNLLAGYLALQLPILIALLFSRTPPHLKTVLAGVTALGLGALVITLSRSGWLSFGTAFTLLFMFSMLHQRLRLRYVFARVLVIVAILSAIGAASGEILRRFEDSDPGALRFRYEMMDAAWRMVVAHPVLGLGLNAFIPNFPTYADRPGVEAVTRDYGETWPVVHDSYLITWTEQGTVGFACLCGLYFSVLWMGWRSARHLLDEYAYAVNLGACCGIVAIMVDGIGSFFIDENAGQRVFFMIVGLIAAVHEWTMVNRAHRKRVEALAKQSAGELAHAT